MFRIIILCDAPPLAKKSGAQF